MRDTIVSSLFHATVNSNISLKSEMTPKKFKELNTFLDGVKRFFLSANVLNIIEIKDPEDADTPKEKLIKGIETLVGMESGGERGFVHLHYRVRVVHKTTLTLKGEYIQRIFNHWYNLSFYSSPASFAKDSGLPFELYIRKQRLEKPGVKISSKIENFDVFEWRDEPDLLTYEKTIV